MSHLLVPAVVTAFLLALFTFLSRASEPSAVLAERAQWAPYATQAAIQSTEIAEYRQRITSTPTPRRSPYYP